MRLREIAQTLLENVNTTLQQFGGRKALVMIGGTATSSDKDLIITFKAKAKNSAKVVKITLQGNDTYKMTFLKRGKTKYSVVEIETLDGLHGEDLKSVFQDKTGLHLSL